MQAFLLAAASLITIVANSPQAGQPVRTTINRSDPSAVETFTIKTKDNTAAAGPDYLATSVTVTFAPQQVAATLLVPTTANPAKAGQSPKVGLIVSNSGGTAVASALASIVEPAAPPPPLPVVTPPPPPPPVVTPPPPPAVAWTHCAAENATCYVVGTANVRYGANGTYLTRSVTGSIACSNGAYGKDPLPKVLKACDTDGQVGSPPAPPPPPVVTPPPPPIPTPPIPNGLAYGQSVKATQQCASLNGNGKTALVGQGFKLVGYGIGFYNHQDVVILEDPSQPSNDGYWAYWVDPSCIQ